MSFVPKSWIDYFLIGNIDIIGFGLDPSEMDIWWLLNCKKRNFKDCGSASLYEPNLNEPDKYAVKALVETFGIAYKTEKVRKSVDYIKFYRDCIESHLDSMIEGS